MTIPEQIKHLIPKGETTTIQFKLRVEDAYKIGVEMVAFSNTQGGTLLIGVNDKTGAISGLSFEEIQVTNALLVNAASENVKPAIIIKTETVSIDSQNIIIATIPQGKDKPYKDNKGIIWVKNGSDKRKVFSNTELRVMMQSCGMLSADSDSVIGSSYKDIAEPTLKNFLFKRYKEELTSAGILGHFAQSTDIEDIIRAIDTNFTNAPIRLFIFDNRIEIHSPGILPDSVTEKNIIQGISVPRNQLLFDNAKYLLPYTGIGSGIMRATKSYDKISLHNNIAIEEFVITILRDETLVDVNDAINSKNEGGKQENEGINNAFEGIKENFEGIKEGVKEDLRTIYSYLKENHLVKLADIKQIINKSNATIERYLKMLKDSGLIEYVGSKKTGGYKVKD